MSKIKFTEDIWTGIIANDFTTDNVARLAKATSVWLLNKNKEASVVIGYDTRFGGKMFSEAAAKVFALMGVKIHISTSIVSAAMVALGVIKKNAQLGIFITANNQHPRYNGTILINENGIPIQEKELKLIESLVPSLNEIDLELLKWKEYKSQGFITYYDIESIYLDHIRNNFDISNLKAYEDKIIFDLLHGCSNRVIKQIFNHSEILNIDKNPLFKNTNPQLTSENLSEISNKIKREKDKIGIVLSGDAKQIKAINENGDCLNSYQIFLLLIYYFFKYKKHKGRILIESFVPDKIKLLAKELGITVKTITPGTNDFSNHFIEENALLALNKKGEIFIKSHPQPDSILISLIILEALKTSKKTLSQLQQEYIEITGSFFFESINIEVKKEIKDKIILSCNEGNLIPLGKCQMIENKNESSFKFLLDDKNWLIISPEKQGLCLSLFTEELKTREETIDKIKNIEKSIIV